MKRAEIGTMCRHGHVFPADAPRGTDGRRLCPACKAERPTARGPRPAPIADRLWRRVQIGGPDDCWLWLGANNGNGYGVIGLGSREAGQTYVHRVAWELANGPIPPDLEVDHLCETRGCVNVRHMQVVTHAENNRRSMSPAGLAARKTHCPAGHPYDEANTYRPPGAPNSRMCRACMRIREAKRHRR
jgi:HNH endonuclease